MLLLYLLKPYTTNSNSSIANIHDDKTYNSPNCTSAARAPRLYAARVDTWRTRKWVGNVDKLVVELFSQETYRPFGAALNLPSSSLATSALTIQGACHSSRACQWEGTRYPPRGNASVWAGRYPVPMGKALAYGDSTFLLREDWSGTAPRIYRGRLEVGGVVVNVIKGGMHVVPIRRSM
jgi:hypothetical protein